MIRLASAAALLFALQLGIAQAEKNPPVEQNSDRKPAALPVEKIDKVVVAPKKCEKRSPGSVSDTIPDPALPTTAQNTSGECAQENQ
jgi:hypothetical protein